MLRDYDEEHPYLNGLFIGGVGFVAGLFAGFVSEYATTRSEMQRRLQSHGDIFRQAYDEQTKAFFSDKMAHERELNSQHLAEKKKLKEAYEAALNAKEAQFRKLLANEGIEQDEKIQAQLTAQKKRLEAQHDEDMKYKQLQWDNTKQRMQHEIETLMVKEASALNHWRHTYHRALQTAGHTSEEANTSGNPPQGLRSILHRNFSKRIKKSQGHKRTLLTGRESIRRGPAAGSP
jgi:hypothetical protein